MEPNITEIILHYIAFVKYLAIFFQDLGIDKNPIQVYETFIYMYQNGFLSSTGKFYLGVPDAYSNAPVPMDVCGSILTTGYGVCRHITDFLNHLYGALGYDSSQLFTRIPKVAVKINHCNPSDYQSAFDEAIKGVDWEANEGFHLIRYIDGIEVIIDSYPTNPYNHTMNIVRWGGDFTHILDATHHSIGEMVDGNILQPHPVVSSHEQGMVITPQVIIQNSSFDTFFPANFSRRLNIAQYDSQYEKDIADALVYIQSCKNYLQAFKEFQTKNQGRCQAISTAIDRLAKKM